MYVDFETLVQPMNYAEVHKKTKCRAGQKNIHRDVELSKQAIENCSCRNGTPSRIRETDLKAVIHGGSNFKKRLFQVLLFNGKVGD